MLGDVMWCDGWCDVMWCDVWLDVKRCHVRVMWCKWCDVMWWWCDVMCMWCKSPFSPSSPAFADRCLPKDTFDHFLCLYVTLDILVNFGNRLIWPVATVVVGIRFSGVLVVRAADSTEVRDLLSRGCKDFRNQWAASRSLQECGNCVEGWSLGIMLKEI